MPNVEFRGFTEKKYQELRNRLKKIAETNGIPTNAIVESFYPNPVTSLAGQNCPVIRIYVTLKGQEYAKIISENFPEFDVEEILVEFRPAKV